VNKRSVTRTCSRSGLATVGNRIRLEGSAAPEECQEEGDETKYDACDGYPAKGRIRKAAATGFSLRHDRGDYQGQNEGARSKSCPGIAPPLLLLGARL